MGDSQNKAIGVAMTTLLQEIEELRVQVNELAANEQGLVRALGDAITRADEKLLNDVRHVTAEHEIRREVILKELQSLASRIGLFPTAHAQAATAAIEDARHELTSYTPPQETIFGRGDWRQAASNIQDEFELQLNGHSAAH
jgi:hypothetical protein